jgi:phosphoglycerate dehydrogenase-like enzyme
MTGRPRSLFVLRADALEATFGEAERQRIAELTDLVGPPQTAEGVSTRPEVLQDIELLISGWGGPRIDRALLENAPRLRAVFYGAGSVAPIMTPEAWDRGLVVTSAFAANAVPVAEYTVAMTMLSLKSVWALARRMHETRTYPRPNVFEGARQRCIGLVSLGAVGRAVVKRLRGIDVAILAYDPYVTRADAGRLGVRLVSLKRLFEQADVVSVHTPHLAETVNLVGAEHLSAMKKGATFINTSHGAVVDEEALAGVALHRPDLQIILDVTRAMPLPCDSPLYGLPNVLLTPHVAGSRGIECRRMGRLIVEELGRYVAGEPLRWRIAPKSTGHTCHGELPGSLESGVTE